MLLRISLGRFWSPSVTMSQYFRIHPENPQLRLIRQAADIIRNGGVIVYPTDSSYALGCQIGDKNALNRIRQIRRLQPKHNFTLVCRDLSELATYARVDNSAYRLIKSSTPGAYTVADGLSPIPPEGGRMSGRSRSSEDGGTGENPSVVVPAASRGRALAHASSPTAELRDRR